MKKKSVLLGLLLLVGIILMSPTAKALENESSIIDNLILDFGEKDGTPYEQISLTLKETVNINNFFIEFYDKSLSEMPAVHVNEFRITNLENPTTKEDYEAGTTIQGDTTLEKGTKLFFYGERKMFESKKINIVSYHENADTRYNEELVYETDTKDLTVLKLDIVKINKDLATYEKFMNEYKKKYPHITPYVGDPDVMAFAYNATNKNEETDIYIPVGTIKFAGKTFDELMAEMDALVNTPITAEIPKDNKIDKNDNILKSLKDFKVSTTYENVKNNSLVYAWTFDGSKMTDEDTKLNINLDIVIGNTTNKDKINSLIPSNLSTLNLDFKHSGLLPNGTSVKLNVSGSFKNDDNLDLYYYNSEKNELEKVSENITVVEGFVTFPLAHCSEYVLVVNNDAKNKADNNVQTSSMNVILYTIISIVTAATLVYILKNKSKEIA